jgi:hypothetical protein
MITFSRSQLVGMEFLDEETVRFHGTQEDHIYAMEVAMDVRIADGRILAIQGWMKRYTTPVCPRAVDRLQDAVGISLRDPSWMPLVMREIGRKGCEHFAEIICECGRCLDQARMSRDLAAALKADPSADLAGLAKQWTASHPERPGATLTVTAV